MYTSILKSKQTHSLSFLIALLSLCYPLCVCAGSLMDRSTSSSDSKNSTNKDNKDDQGGAGDSASQNDGSREKQEGSSKQDEQSKSLIDRQVADSQASKNLDNRSKEAQAQARDQDKLESARLSNDPEGGLSKKSGFGNAGSKALGLAGGAASAGAGALGSLGAAGLGGLGALGALGIGAGGLMALKLLAQGIVSSPICFTACNRLACKSARVRAMCESKCSANPAAIKKCLAQGS